MKFAKAHGLGNDFILVPAAEAARDCFTINHLLVLAAGNGVVGGEVLGFVLGLGIGRVGLADQRPQVDGLGVAAVGTFQFALRRIEVELCAAAGTGELATGGRLVAAGDGRGGCTGP